MVTTRDQALEIAAKVLDEVVDSFAEHNLVDDLRSNLSLEYDTLVSFLFVSEEEMRTGCFAIHRFIKEEGITV